MSWWLIIIGLSFGGIALFIGGVALWFFFHQRLEAEPAIRPFSHWLPNLTKFGLIWT